MYLRVYDANGALKNTSANFTDAEIKTKYESNADTNAYTDSEKTKLAGIESGATGDQTGAEIDALLDTEIGHSNWTLDWTNASQNFLTTGSVTCGTFTSTGIDDNADQTVLTLGADESATFAGDVAIGQSTTPQAKLSLGTNTADKKILLYDANNNYHYGFGLPNANEHRAFIPNTSSHFFSWGAYSVSDGSTFYEKMRLSFPNAALELKSGIDLNVENGDVVIGTSGKGIDYTAAGGDVLDQYKEGTFTGSLGGSTGGTPVTATGDYTKTGNTYFVTIEFSSVDLTGHTGFLQVTGFPEAAARATISKAQVKNALSTVTGTMARLSGTTVTFRIDGDTNAKNVNAATGCTVQINIQYHA